MFNNLPEQLFSPAKIIYLGYLLSIYFDKYSFNGKNFIIYDKSNGLSDNRVFSLLEDSEELVPHCTGVRAYSVHIRIEPALQVAHS